MIIYMTAISSITDFLSFILSPFEDKMMHFKAHKQLLTIVKQISVLKLRYFDITQLS